MKDFELIPGDILFIRINGSLAHMAIVSASRHENAPCIILHYPGRVAPHALTKRYLYPSELMQEKGMTLEVIRPEDGSKTAASLEILNMWLRVQPINDDNRRTYLQTSNPIQDTEQALSLASEAFNLTSFNLLKFSARGHVPHQIQDNCNFTKGFHCVSGLMIALQLPYIAPSFMTIVPEQLVSDKYPDLQDLAQFYTQDQLSRLQALKVTEQDPPYLQYLQVLQTGRYKDLVLGKPADPQHGLYFSSRHYCSYEPSRDFLEQLPEGLRYEARLMNPEMLFNALKKDAAHFKVIGSLGPDDVAGYVPDSLEMCTDYQSQIGAETRSNYKRPAVK